MTDKPFKLSVKCLAYSLALAVALMPTLSQAACAGTIYLTLDTGNMHDAPRIATILAKYQVKATFFVANELTWPDRAHGALQEHWAPYWKARVAEGHAIGSHTWRHGLFSGDNASAQTVNYRPQFGAQAGQTLALNRNQICEEIKRSDTEFKAMTGKSLDAIWRAPGGRTTPITIAAAQQCGYAHVHWAPAGFLGDELSSEKFPNKMLLDRALRNIADGDIVMGHLGIWSRKEPFIEIFEPLIVGLKAKGMCFAKITEHPNYVGTTR
jgi:peptidoglycan/xylan/chitin deacetylase (PgdA/CDA1 family)